MNIISEPEENYKTGWIKLFRSLENHWIWTNEKYFKTWIWFLFRANHKSTKILFSGELIDINRGEFLTSLKNISEAAKLSIQESRHFLALLEKDKMIFKISNTQSTKITICNYDTYQDLQQTNNKPTTNKQQTGNKQTTTDNNEKNLNNEKELFISKIQSEFYESLKQYIPDFTPKVLRDFFDYWSEPNKSMTKIKWQLERTWDSKKRLTRWSNNNFNKNEKTFTNNRPDKNAETFRAASDLQRRIEEDNIRQK